MDQARIAEIALRIEHRHGDGSWAQMQEDRSHHDAADHDPERGWSLRRIFRCSRCDESITVGPGDDGGPFEER